MVKQTLTSAVAVALFAGSVLSGCVVAVRPAAPGLYVGGAIGVAPPAVPVEEVGVAPAPGYVWMAGYWNWLGARYVWVAGHWGPGRPGFVWVQHRWVRGAGGWRMAPGHWRRV
jgi:hypothetical protein